jgi:protein-tyrosine phosphatase
LAVQDLLARARAGQHVEVGCLGGHGRTGTTHAYLAVLTGVAPGDGVAWVRENYCAKAVETSGQEASVLRFHL